MYFLSAKLINLPLSSADTVLLSLNTGPRDRGAQKDRPSNASPGQQQCWLTASSPAHLPRDGGRGRQKTSRRATHFTRPTAREPNARGRSYSSLATRGLRGVYLAWEKLPRVLISAEKRWKNLLNRLLTAYLTKLNPKENLNARKFYSRAKKNPTE